MSGDNGNIDKLQPPPEQEIKPIKMEIILEPGKPMRVGFPLLADRIATYGFLKMAEKTLDAHYVQKPKIVQPHGIMDFVKGGKRRKF